jgi:REP element-mobilizing transposase RayT
MERKGYYTRGYLPHWDAENVIQMVTFRLADSLPRDVVERIRKAAEKLEDSKRAATVLANMEAFLDRGVGECWFKRPQLAELMEQTLLHFNGSRYSLFAWIIMPNHVHVLFQPKAEYEMGAIIKSWKGYATVQGNKLLGRSGEMFQREYFDRFIRNEEHLERAAAYIHYNPVKAGLAEHPGDYQWSSYRLVHGQDKGQEPI